MSQREGITARLVGLVIKANADDPVPYEIVRFDSHPDVPARVLFRRPGVAPPESYAHDPNYDPVCETADWRQVLEREGVQIC